MNRYGSTARDRYAATVVSLILIALVITVLGVLAARVTGSVEDRLDHATEGTR